MTTVGTIPCPDCGLEVIVNRDWNQTDEIHYLTFKHAEPSCEEPNLSKLLRVWMKKGGEHAMGGMGSTPR